MSTTREKRANARPSLQLAFTETEREAVKKVVDHIDLVSSKRVDEGFSQRNFSLGVLNCLFIAFAFGRFPQHCWLIFLCQLMVMYPWKFIQSWTNQPLCETLYFLDYCWISNFSAVAALFALLVDYITGANYLNETIRHHMFLAAYGASCGVLLSASMALPFVTVVFHDPNVMMSLFIHVLPPMVAYTLMWHNQEIAEAWPGLFQFSYLDKVVFTPEGKFLILPGTHLDTVAGATLAFYWAWFIPYICWMILIGLDLPRKNRIAKDGTPIVPKYDTVFHSAVRGGFPTVLGKVLWGRPESVSREQIRNDDYELRDFLVYMGMHATLSSCAVYVVAYSCYRSQTIHMTLLIILAIICVRRGASRYTYYVTEMYGKMIRQEFAELLVEPDDSKMKKH